MGSLVGCNISRGTSTHQIPYLNMICLLGSSEIGFGILPIRILVVLWNNVTSTTHSPAQYTPQIYDSHPQFTLRSSVDDLRTQNKAYMK